MFNAAGPRVPEVFFCREKCMFFMPYVTGHLWVLMLNNLKNADKIYASDVLIFETSAFFFYKAYLFVTYFRINNDHFAVAASLYFSCVHSLYFVRYKLKFM